MKSNVVSVSKLFKLLIVCNLGLFYDYLIFSFLACSTFFMLLLFPVFVMLSARTSLFLCRRILEIDSLLTILSPFPSYSASSSSSSSSKLYNEELPFSGDSSKINSYVVPFFFLIAAKSNLIFGWLSSVGGLTSITSFLLCRFFDPRWTVFVLTSKVFSFSTSLLFFKDTHTHAQNIIRKMI